MRFNYTVLLLPLLLLVPACSMTAQVPSKQGKSKTAVKAVDSTEVQQLKDQIAGLKDKIASLEKELAELEPIRQQWADHLAVSLDGKWDNVPYGEVNATSLDEDIALCDQFGPYNAKLQQYAGELKQLKDRVDLFDLGTLIVSEPYDKAVVDDVAPKVKDLLATVRKEKRDPKLIKPVADLSDQLGSYGLALSAFQDLIRSVDPLLVRFKSSKVAAWNAASSVIEQKEKDEETVSFICQIPWLKAQYEAYYAALKKDALAPNAARDTIMDLKP